jgi:hypothetical protein
MAVSLVSSGVTFPDNTTQTTAASAVTAGNGISVSSGTVAIAAPSFNSVGSYVIARGIGNMSNQSNYSLTDVASIVFGAGDTAFQVVSSNVLSGSWRWLGGGGNYNDAIISLAVRVS